MQGESGNFAYLAIAEVVLPGWYCLQFEDIATLLGTHSDSIGDGMSFALQRSSQWIDNNGLSGDSLLFMDARARTADNAIVSFRNSKGLKSICE